MKAIATTTARTPATFRLNLLEGVLGVGGGGNSAAALDLGGLHLLLGAAPGLERLCHCCYLAQRRPRIPVGPLRRVNFPPPRLFLHNPGGSGLLISIQRNGRLWLKSESMRKCMRT
jgi:hypothetical protein